MVSALPLRDGDVTFLHENQPPNWQPGGFSVLLIHGLSGCHRSGYMVRMANRFIREGFRCFRMDMRSCGYAADHSRHVTHAGRSDDVIDALQWIAQRTERGPIAAIGISMGGNQLLRGIGRLDHQERRDLDRVCRVAAIAPPIDLLSCSRNMERPLLRPYNRYFIRQLLRKVPSTIASGDAFRRLKLDPQPRTIREFDERVTAPLGGFASAAQYYADAAALPHLRRLDIPTLIIAAEDDPIVPAEIIRAAETSPRLARLITRHGGHAAFVGPRGTNWLDDYLVEWIRSNTATAAAVAGPEPEPTA